MAGETVRAMQLQPEWLRALRVDVRLPGGADVVFAGCGRGVVCTPELERSWCHTAGYTCAVAAAGRARAAYQ